MAPIGTVLKNGLIFAILSAPLLYLAALQFARGLADIMYTFDVGGDYREPVPNDKFWSTGVLEIFIALIFSISLVGVVFMKFLSDTVEEGMIEF
ncbi:MAG: hypothetical protein ACW98K_04315 [Candidatus Kariarchaeaceae archaeon]|jgi:hypothetical protein